MCTLWLGEEIVAPNERYDVWGIGHVTDEDIRRWRLVPFIKPPRVEGLALQYKVEGYKKS